MRIIFMGTPDFAVVSLQKLLQSDHDVVAVVTIPDKQKGRGQKTRPSTVKKFVQTQNLPLLQPDRLNDEDFVATLKAYKAEAFVVVAFRILPQAVFSLPAFGTINLHGSYLPKYRGAAPINWALINGDRWSGVSTILINKQVDTGDLLLQTKVDIPADMNAGELHDLLALRGAELLIETLNGLEAGTLFPRKQDHTLSSKAPKITKEFCHLDFNRPALQVHNFVRGLSPYPAAFSYLNGQPFKIYKTRLTDQNSNLPCASVTRVTRHSFFIQCTDIEIEILEVQAAGKKRMNASAFLNGYQLVPGVVLK